MLLLPFEEYHEKVHEVRDDFDYAGSTATTLPFLMPSGYIYTVPGGPLGSIISGDFRGGRAVMLTDNGDGTLATIVTGNELFNYTIGKPIRSRARVKLGIDTTLPEETNIFVGCMEALETTPLQDAGAGPKVNVDAFGFYKPETGGAVYNQYWHAFSQFGDTPAFQITELSAANLNNLSGVDWKPWDATTGHGIRVDMVAEWMPLGRVSATVFEAEVRFWLRQETMTAAGLSTDVWTDWVLVAKHRMHGNYAITEATSDLMNHGVALLNTTDIVELDVDMVKCTQLW